MLSLKEENSMFWEKAPVGRKPWPAGLARHGVGRLVGGRCGEVFGRRLDFLGGLRRLRGESSLDSAIWRASMRLGSFGGERTGGLDRIASRGIVRMNIVRRMPTIDKGGCSWH